MDRRKFLVTAGAGLTVLGVGSAIPVLSWNSALRSATEPWRQAGQSFGDIRLDCLAYAILAPNPHNLQPWLVRLDGADMVSLYYDTQKGLPQTDPFDRQITIGFGAFLELLRQAAASRGYRLTITNFPDGAPRTQLDNRRVAQIQFVAAPDTPPEPLFAHVLARRTVRVPFDARPVADDVLRTLASPGLFANTRIGRVDTTNVPAQVDVLKAICHAGWEVELSTPATYQESVDLMRTGAAAVAANPDGISLSGIPMELGRLSGLLSPQALATKDSIAYNASRDFYNGLIASARAFAWISTRSNSRASQLATGAAWVRLHLRATAAGISLHPLSQVLQEFPEMAPHYTRFHDVVRVAKPRRVQGLLRLGYAPAQKPAPRWPLRSHLLDA